MGTKQTVSPKFGGTVKAKAKSTTSDSPPPSPTDKSLIKSKPNRRMSTNRESSTEANTLPAQKSVVVAYVLWLFGGIFGLHHLYLHRDRHAFIWACTLGGYMGIGWIGELFLIPEYVRDANEDPRFVKAFVAKLQAFQRPPYSSKRFVGQVMIGHLFGQLFAMAIPQTVVAGFDLSFLHWAIPIFVSQGIWLVGNIGREQGVWWHCLLAAYLAYPARYFIYDETYSLLLTGLVSALTFDGISKQWRRTPPRRGRPVERSLKLTGAILIYCTFWGSFVYFNGTIADEDGGEVPIHEALHNFLASAWWTDLKQALHDTYIYAQHHGWYETWKEVFESMDVDGERNSYKVLGVSATASQAEITAAYRRLSKEYHPDKVKDEALRNEAHQRFIEIQQAYNVLSKIKSNRRRKNKQFQEDDAIVL
ncbi:dnaJ homolog subfamily C member 22 [Drosophila pseudoobscura]|uniref:DnaJ homolog subfamily C member 22 n=1 Tax=Drosophila pseudoobscura pseudoobscura TaxID=46245 RepID=Q29FL6_DROPS|nr:dnaJ homolog subfamily C member 22 [Drosophila pseudoobscura]XP_015042395.1 dnaJ homolog subfamily C member 22 [Drosophila pseudoobscura]XP_033240772.1 dnaJ homolog subfamily C member 22 [Drosophila pseudoobscura]